MNVPINPRSIIDNRHKWDFSSEFANHPLEPARSGLTLSFEAQRQQRSLREYIDYCHTVLDEIRQDLNHFEMHSGNPAILSRAAKNLGRFCLDADSWGFNSLYDVALALQTILLKSGKGFWDNPSWEVIKKGLFILSTLVEQCETDIHRRSAVNETLECLH
jgi:hypothetical protein